MIGALQRVLLEACLAADPPAFLATQLARDDLALSAGERAMLARIDADALRLTGTLVRKLRFERLLAGDRALQQEFVADPAGFAATFAAYVQAVPPTTVFPAGEAASFAAFRHRAPGGTIA